jgi:hypothetical protein
MRSVDGIWAGHYWLETNSVSGKNAYILDLTADQFGWADVMACPLGDRRYLSTISRRDISLHAQTFVGYAQNWLKLWSPSGSGISP